MFLNIIILSKIMSIEKILFNMQVFANYRSTLYTYRKPKQIMSKRKTNIYIYFFF